MLSFFVIMKRSKSTRLRKTSLLIDSSDEEEEETADEEEYTPVTPSNQPTAAKGRGLPPIVQQKLIDALNSKGGLANVTNKSRILQEVCDEDPVSFGGSPELKTPRGRRRKTQNFVDKLKVLSKDHSKLSKRIAKIEKAATTAKSTIPSAPSRATPQPTSATATATPTKAKMFRKDKKSKAQAKSKMVMALAFPSVVPPLLVSHYSFLLRLIAALVEYTEEAYKFDPSEEIYGDLCVIRCTDEVAKPNYIDCYAILQPAVDIRDVPHLKATFTDSNKVEVITVGTRHTFKNNSNGWLKVLETLQDKLNATKLVSTLRSSMTTLKKTQHIKRITITFDEELSNEYLNPGAPEASLTLVPLPYIYSHETTSKKTKKTSQYKNTEVCVLWRAFVVDSERPLGEDEADSDVEDLMDAMGDLLGEQSTI